MVIKRAILPVVKERKKRVPGDKKELKAILKTLKEIRDILDNMWWRERRA